MISPMTYFPAEWISQSGVLLTWPHSDTDWKNNLEEVTACFVSIAEEILKREKLIIVCQSIKEVKRALARSNPNYERIVFREIRSNDTWARDHGPLAIFVNDTPGLFDFGFNGWGLRFPANYDNQITRQLYASKAFSPKVKYMDMKHLVLEGGSIDVDGKGTLLATSRCLMSINRHDYMTRKEIADFFCMFMGMKRVLWLDHGYLAGDDTDGHIDTLARFCNASTIAYVQCTDPDDEHFKELSCMENELRQFRNLHGKFYHLLPLPMAEPVYNEGKRLPATYANFLIINGAVLLPFYNSPRDEIAKQQLQSVFPDREIIGINCLPLIKQNGSLHCVTMQLPVGYV